MLIPTAETRIDHAGRSPARVLLVGEPVLRQTCRAIEDFGASDVIADAATLVATLEHFRSVTGFGRGIAAPQIGIPRRLVALDLGDGPFVLCNPTLTRRSDDTFTLWDDCMSFPWIMVQVQRHVAVTLEYADLQGGHHSHADLDRSTSELIQHELDHLDGILALDRAVDRRGIISREVYEARRSYFDEQVDYSIVPTIRQA